MNIVADTNTFLVIALDEPEKRRIINVTAEASLLAPEILPYEIGNAISVMVKRKQVLAEDALTVHKLANRIPVRLVQVDVAAALALAIEHNIYAYDAYFLQCAKTWSYPLLTLDKRMHQVAKVMNVNILE